MNMRTRYLLFLLIILMLSCTHHEPGKIELADWKFKKGDNPEWANPKYNTNDWSAINPSKVWEAQGYTEYDGYAWYRTSFFLPLSLKNSAYLKDSLQILLGKIDDTDQTFLNGHLIGQNGNTLSSFQTTTPGKFEYDSSAYKEIRNYILSVKDNRINWSGRNVLAVRVHDHGGEGGLYSDDQHLSMRDFNDYLQIDIKQFPFEFENNGKNISKTVAFENISEEYEIHGDLSLRVQNVENNQFIFNRNIKEVSFIEGDSDNYDLSFKVQKDKRYRLICSFTEKNSRLSFTRSMEIPYILTPESPDRPRINGPDVYGIRPGSPFIYRIPATGKRPMQFQANNLPYNLKLDQETGIITGKLWRRGDYEVELIASNELGEDRKTLTLRSGENIALTPPMGWNSWNCWGLTVSAEKIREAADFMVSSGLVNHGWQYINIDDGWTADQRTSNGFIQGNEKFPDMKALADYVHSKGLKLGIYSSPGPETCGGYTGSHQFEAQDAYIFGQWGVDYLKYDWCSYEQIATDHSPEELKKPYIQMRRALNNTKRDIVYSICQYGMGNVWQWGEEVGGNLWRTTGDITDSWESMSNIGFGQDSLAPYAGPGHWNDPDMLVVGDVGWGANTHPSRLSANEQYTHISLWSLLSAPLLLGCDLSQLDDFTLNLLTNDEVIAVNQDPLGNQATRIHQEGKVEIWAKTLQDSSLAMGLFNRGGQDVDYTLNMKDIGLKETYLIRDLWRQKDLGSFSGEFETEIPKHGVVLTKWKVQK